MAEFFKRVVDDVHLLGHRNEGWRTPQLGALGAILAHWSLADRDPTVISIPTGTGKTAVAMAAPFLMSQPPHRILVLAPTRQIRRQLVTQFSSYAQLTRIGVLPQTLERPVVFEMSGRADDWSKLESSDVVVALPNSISPVHYDSERLPPPDFFDLIVVDEAHHAPAETWRSVLDYHSNARMLLLTATPRRRDGKRIPGSLQYYYPLRRALEEGLYKPIRPILLRASDPSNKRKSDADIASHTAKLMAMKEHRTSTLIVRGGTIARLEELRSVYEQAGIELALLHNRMSAADQHDTIDRLRAGETRAVGVVGMLGEGFDLPSLRIAAYHDKHRSLPATIQLIGRLARVHPDYPQPSVLVAVADADVFPELKGVVRDLYQEDADWATVLPGIIDAEIQQEKISREFAEHFPPSQSEVDAAHLRPLKRAVVYEVPADWTPPFLTDSPMELVTGASFAGGTIIYSGADAESGLLAIVVKYLARPKWSSDPALANVRYELHVIAHRKPPRVTLPGLVMLNLDRDGIQSQFEKVLGLDTIGRLAGPERIGEYLDSLERVSVSSVGIRSTNAATRGRATYKNFMGRSVDRGLRSVDMARSALGHVMFQVDTEAGAANAGGAVEKSKLWLTRYGELLELSEWIDETAALLWFPQQTAQGPLLPGMDRGRRLDKWPTARPLAAELYPGLLGIGLELWQGGVRLGSLEDLDLYVNDDPTGTLNDVDAVSGSLRIVGVLNDRGRDRQACVWDAQISTGGQITAQRDVEVRRGYGESESLATVFELHPPTIYFLDGTTTVGQVRYDSRALTSSFDITLLKSLDWSAVDISAETHKTAKKRGKGRLSVHAHLAEYLRSRPRIGVHRWIITNDGAGEIADYLVVEEFPTGELRLELWHAKASRSSAAATRVKDWQELVAQAIRSRRHFASTTLWSELGARLEGRSAPRASLVDGSDEHALLYERLGLAEGADPDSAWTRRFPVVRGVLGLVQPGLSASILKNELETEPQPAGAQSLRELFSVLSDMTQSDGTDLVVIVSA